jgi:eukaryotic-like serine/threonine-protein kinase
MTIAAGSRFGPYVIETLLGTGGMGEVYRAHDTRLKRNVALKMLPATSASDPERLARFHREAQVLASLDHPHIGAIYGIEESDGTTALVLQLVEGDTLADRVERGPIPPDEALPIARQIAEALEAAHEQGVIHRDLKPANVKITPDGQVKVLDFGLAKLSETSGASESGRPSGREAATMSPTITTPALMTGVGVILGTAAYMSPEQAKGRTADKRSDIWAFGCLLYEMLTGKRAFEGDDVADTLAAVIRGEPDWSALPRHVPPAIIALLKRCVVKDRRERISDAAAVLFVLREPASVGASIGLPESTAPGPSRWRRASAYLAVATAVAAITSAAWWMLRPQAEPRLVARFTIATPDDLRLLATVQSVVAISRDGTKIAYQTNRGVHIRSLSNPNATLVSTGGVNPVFSPDGNWLAFYSSPERAIRKISVAGGTPITLCEVADSPSGISWSGEHIVFGQGSGGIMRVSEDSGKAEVLVTPQQGELTVAPQILPDGDTLLYTAAREEGGLQTWTWDRARIVAQSLTSSRRVTLVEGASDARYISSGHLLYAIGGVMFAQPFDLQKWEFSGPRVPVVDGVRRGAASGATIQNTRLFSAAQLVVSDNGTLVYVPGPSSPSGLRMQLVLTDRSGAITPLKMPPGPYYFPRSSPDGAQIVYGTDDGKEAAVWTHDLRGTASPQRLTFEGRNRFPAWSGDGQWIAFQSDRESDLGIFRQRADGTTGKAERLTRADSGVAHAPESWSPDGKVLLFSSTKGSEVTLQILSLPDGTVKPFPGVRSDRWPNAVFSPDGSRVAYSTRQDEPRNSLYVEPFPPTSEKRLIATGDAQMPVWSRDGRELLFVDPARPDNGRIGFSRVTIDTRRGFAVSGPERVPRPFNITGPGIGRPRTYDILPDGKFVGVMDEGAPGEATPRIEVVLNWHEELKARVPTRP